MIDSLSRMTVKAVEDIYDKNVIGESGMNTGHEQRSGQEDCSTNYRRFVPTGTYLFLTAHVKDVINMEMYPTDTEPVYMKKDTVLEGVSGGFYSLPNNVWMITANKPLQNKDKMPEYPGNSKP